MTEQPRGKDGKFEKKENSKSERKHLTKEEWKRIVLERQIKEKADNEKELCEYEIIRRLQELIDIAKHLANPGLNACLNQALQEMGVVYSE